MKLGLATVNLEGLSLDGLTRTADGIVRRKLELIVPVHEVAGGFQKVADVCMVLAFEDLGNELMAGESRSVSLLSPSLHPLSQSQEVAADGEGEDREVSIRKSKEYKIAFEFETWKHRVTQEFEDLFRVEHQDLMDERWRGWNAQEEWRGDLVKQKELSIESVESKIRDLLPTIERREKLFREQERQFERKKLAWGQEVDVLTNAARDESHRLQTEHDEQLNGQRAASSLLQSQKSQLDSDIATLITRLRNMQQELASRQRPLPDASDLALLRAEKLHLQKNLDECKTTKNYYKHSWLTALKTIAELRQSVDDQVFGRLMKEQREAEHMRLRYLSMEENSLIEGVRPVQKEIKEISSEQ